MAQYLLKVIVFPRPHDGQVFTARLFTIPTWPAIEAQLRSVRMPPGQRLGLPHQDWSLWPSPTVGAAAFPLDPQRWPGIEQLLRSFRQGDNRRLILPRHAWTQPTWPLVGAAGFPLDPQVWPAIETGLRAFRTPRRPDAIPQGQFGQGWVSFGASVLPLDAQLWPGIEPKGERVRARRGAVPAGHVDSGWIGASVTPPPAFDPALLPRMVVAPLPARRAAASSQLGSACQDGWIRTAIPETSTTEGKLTASGVGGKSKYMGAYNVAPHPFGV